MVRIILDTGVFYYPEALAELRNVPIDIIVPAVALAERVRQLQRDGRDEATFFEGLAEAGITPEALTPDAACQVARPISDDRTWKRLSRDAFIAAHLRPGDELWTTNPRDFIALGVPADQIVTVRA